MEKVKQKIYDDLHSLPTGALSSVLNKAKRYKQSLHDKLGHNADNDYRTLVPISVSEDEWLAAHYSHPWLKDTIENYFKGTVTCCKNEVMHNGQVGKLTRVIMADLNKYRFRHPFRDKVMEYYEWDENQIGQKLGELFNPKTTRTLVISTNPYDFLTASGRYWGLASFSSCHDFEGCHFSGNISYMMDDITVLVYVAELRRLDYKIGRSWAYLKDGCILQPKSYGTFSAVQRKTAREYLETIISPDHKWLHKELKDFNGNEGGGVNYLDTDGMSFAHPKGINDPPLLNFNEPYCLECGEQHCNEEGGVCESCFDDHETCSCCDTRLSDDDSYHNENGDTYCSDCYYDHYTTCSDCGDKIRRNYDNYYCVDGEVYCEDCYDKFYVTCDSCGESILKDDICECNGNSYCESCASRKGYQRCDECGDYSDDLLYVEDIAKDHCPDCITAKQCADCGGYFNEYVTIDGKTYCPDCAAEQELDEAA